MKLSDKYYHYRQAIRCLFGRHITVLDMGGTISTLHPDGGFEVKDLPRREGWHCCSCKKDLEW